MAPLVDIKPTKQIYVSTSGNDSDSGGLSNPVRTIQEAVDRADAGTMIMVREGTYTENVRFTNSGTSTAPIQLVSADGTGAAKIKPSDGNYNTVIGHSVENIVVKGFDIAYSGGSNGNGISFTTASSDLSNPSKNIVIVDNIIHGDGEDGIKISVTDRAYIINNTISGASDQGIDLVGVFGGQISGNTVTNVSGNSGIQAKGGSTDIAISGNKVSGTAENGIHVGGATDEEFMRSSANYEAARTTVTNNTVTDVDGRGILVSGAHDTTIANNSITGTGSTAVHLAESGWTHSPAYVTKNTTIHDNTVDQSSWLQVDGGQDGGLETTSGPAGSAPPSSEEDTPPETAAPPSSEEDTPPEADAPPSSEEDAPPETVTPPGDDSGSDTSPIAEDQGLPGQLIAGTGRNDTLTGTSGDDVLTGYSGNDTLVGDAGDDQLSGGSGSDRLESGAGRDLMFGGSGDDHLVDTAGNGNWFDGGSGTNRFTSAKGAEDVFVMDGKSYIQGKGNFEIGTDKIAVVIPGGISGTEFAVMVGENFVQEDAYQGVRLSNATVLQTGNETLSTADGWADNASKIFEVYDSFADLQVDSGFDWSGA